MRHVIDKAPPAEEQAVVVNIRLSNERQGTEHEQARLSMLAQAVKATLDAHPGCELGACQVTRGFGVLYCYGPDASLVYEVLEPLLVDYRPGPGSFAIVRHGGATDTTAPRDRIDL